MDKTKVINFGLVFEDDFARFLEQYSQRLSLNIPGSYVLGVNSLPHISVVQLRDDRPTEQIWALAGKVAGQPIKVELKGLYFDPEKNNKRVWFGIRVALTDDLIELQNDLIGSVKPQTIVNQNGAGYFPHITLGYSEPLEALPAISFEGLPTILETVSCTLALGRSGPDYQFAEKIYG